MRIAAGLVAFVGVILVVLVARQPRTEGRRPEDVTSTAPPTAGVATGPIVPVGPAAARRARAARMGAAAPAPGGASPEAPAAVEPGPDTDERDRQVAALRNSGADSGELTGRTNRIRLTLEKIVKDSSVAGSGDPWECHRAGCFTTVVERSGPSVEALTTTILASDEVTSWPGRSMRSGTIPRVDGTYESTWFFFAPSDAGQKESTARAER